MRHRLPVFRIFLLLCLGLLAACQQPQPIVVEARLDAASLPAPPSTEPPVQTEKIIYIPQENKEKTPPQPKPPSMALVSVYGEPELSGLYKIEKDRVSLPFIGQLSLKGLTETEAAKAIETAYLDGYLVNPDIRVTYFKDSPYLSLNAQKDLK